MGMRLAGALALVLGVVTFAGPAFAGSGNGNGGNNGNNGKADSGSAVVSAPGNSADAPGQLKKDDGASSQAAMTTTTASPVVTSSASTSSQGVKPANNTAHDTHAAASSTKTKLYGNGQTAGQIAIRNGAARSTVLHGPGNSQPHKASPCSGGREVDVHALKAKRHARGCGSSSGPTGSDDGSKKDGGSTTGSDPGHASDPGTQPGAHVTATRPKPKPSSRMTSPESAAVLASIQRPAGATLPFTGFPLWVGVGLGVVLLALGLALSLLAGRETERKVGP